MEEYTATYYYIKEAIESGRYLVNTALGLIIVPRGYPLKFNTNKRQAHPTVALYIKSANVNYTVLVHKVLHMSTTVQWLLS